MVWGPRTIPDYQLVYIIHGSATMEYAGRKLELRPGHCIFYGSHTPHRLAASPLAPLTIASVHFRFDAQSPEPVSPHPYLKACPESDLQLPAVTYTIEVEGIGDLELWPLFDVKGVEGLFIRMAKEFLHRDPGFEAILRGYLIQLLGSLIRFQLDKRYRAANESSKIAVAVEAIRNRPAHAWSIPELAAIVGYHPTYFAELFREATGYAPKHFLVMERIKQAQLLLLQEKSVEAVAEKLGYSSVHYFSRNFKAVTGRTPSEFKLHNQEF
ncbi:helix-turn-helix transcriptional regulator [Paenibacillus frigoriresistens]|uniref:AraC family transcriptional regulator n=1 Tax=Paenibacillus alginolyticus TaxID=59839 RepID=UPI0015656D54|nr:AraC family transcriptional regulator [Paenibacillus frigoriresistens]NRF95368.1 helix-turn-helix transcriptional regulator [Paenibacillus frigoriresistens]